MAPRLSTKKYGHSTLVQKRYLQGLLYIISVLVVVKKNPDVPGLGIFETFTFLFN